MGLRETRKAARRQAIEDAGLALFLEDGFERCSVERIVASVGIARGTFYLYFPDKLSLFEALCERLYGPLVATLERSRGLLGRAPSPEHQQLLYLQMSMALAEQLEGARPLMLLHFREHRSAAASGQVVAGWMQKVEDLAVSILEDAHERGLVRDIQPVTVALAIIGSAERLIWAWLTGDERLDADRAVLELANVFYSGIR